MTIDRTITQRLVSVEASIKALHAKIDRLLDMLDPDGPSQQAMHHDLESILANIGQAVLTPMAREVKG